MTADSVDRRRRTSTTGTVTIPSQFVGAYFDSYAGLYKMGQRSYDPALGRFTQQDPKIQWANPNGWNRYLYGPDDPVNDVDPTGANSVPWQVTGVILRVSGAGLAAAAILKGDPVAAPWLGPRFCWGAAPCCRARL